MSALWEGVKFWCLILAIMAVGGALVAFAGNVFGWREWLDAHRSMMGLAAVGFIVAAIVLRERGK